MSEYTIVKIFRNDKRSIAAVERLLHKNGISLDANLDYTCGITDPSGEFIATGSCFSNTIRCVAVEPQFKGEGLLNLIITHLLEHLSQKNLFHVFIYTKYSTALFFKKLGFYKVTSVRDTISFLENRKNGFKNYLDRLEPPSEKKEKAAAVVMNCNPFTLGHQHLIEEACSTNDQVHLFMLSEDASIFPFKVRRNLILMGTAHLRNLTYHESGPYMISNGTFPSYFQKDSNQAIESQAYLDANIFINMAERLGIRNRYLGSEPTSNVTHRYNKVLQKHLPQSGINVTIVERKTNRGKAISASAVRQHIKAGCFDILPELLPQTTLDFLKSKEAAPIIQRIKNSNNVIHY